MGGNKKSAKEEIVLGMAGNEYDIIVIGSGPAGQRAAIQAGKLGRKVALIDSNPRVGGVCLYDGTIPSKSFREAILHLSGYRLRSHFGEAFRVKHNIEMADLTRWSVEIVSNIEQNLLTHLIRNQVSIICGMASLQDAHHVCVKQGAMQEVFSADNIVLATGTVPRHPPGFEFDGQVIVDSNGILHLEKLPRTMAVVGGGVIGSEYASMFATLGVEVTIIEAHSSILSHVDVDIRDALCHYLRQQRVTILTHEKVDKCRLAPDGRAIVFLESGKRIVSDTLLVSAGRVGNTAALNLEALGIKCGSDGVVEVNENFQTSVPNVYAVGDLASSKRLASTALEQGRRAVCHAFSLEDPFPGLFTGLPTPYGIYSIPEIAMVGKNEAELTQAKVPYETGIARFCDLEKGKIIGDNEGLLKLLINPYTMEVLGVHAIGEGVTEIIHIGQAVIAQKGSLGVLVHMVFNYPSLAQAYKVAALDAFNKIVATRNLPEEG